jgi:hypothetical protein
MMVWHVKHLNKEKKITSKKLKKLETILKKEKITIKKKEKKSHNLCEV